MTFIKLKKNDYQEIRKGGIKAVETKLAELVSQSADIHMQKMKNELKDLKAGKITRLAISKLKTMLTELKGEL